MNSKSVDLQSCLLFSRPAKTMLALLAALAFSLDSRAAVSDEDIRGFAACQAWSSAVLSSPASFTEEWRSWSMGLWVAAIATPANDDWSPFKSDKRFVDQVSAYRRRFAAEPISAASPAYADAHADCMVLVKMIEKRRPAPKAPTPSTDSPPTFPAH